MNVQKLVEDVQKLVAVVDAFAAQSNEIERQIAVITSRVEDMERRCRDAKIVDAGIVTVAEFRRRFGLEVV